MTSQRTYETPDAPGTYSDHYLLVDKPGAVSATKVRVDAFKDWLLAGYTSGYVGGNIATITNGTAAAAQKVVTVLSTTGFVAGGYAAYSLVDGTFEYNLIATVTDPTHLLLTTNIGATGIGNGVYVGMISPEAYASANAIPHAGTLVMPDTMRYANAGRFHVGAYGAAPGAAQSVNTAGINAAIAAAKAAKGYVQFSSGTYAYDGALDVCDTKDIGLRGRAYHGTILECHNTGGAAIEIIGSKNIHISDLQITGHGTDTPAVGIWTGRSTTPGTGIDTSKIWFERVYVYGAFTTAAWYVTGSESNHFHGCQVYITNATCKAGIMFDWENTAGTGDTANALTPEHTTLHTLYAQAMGFIFNSLINSVDTAAAFSPIYIVNETGTVQLQNTYVTAWGKPIYYMLGTGVLEVLNDYVEGTPSHIIHGDYLTGASNDFTVHMQGCSGPAASSGSALYFDDNTTVRNSLIERCNYIDDLRFWDIVASRVENWNSYSSVNDPALVVAHQSINCQFEINYEDTYSNAGPLNTTIVYNSNVTAGYTHLPGLAVNRDQIPGATGEAVIQRILRASAPWSPGVIADGAQARVMVDLAGVTQAVPWFCMAHFSGIGGYAAWDIYAVAGDGAVGVSIVNRTGGALTPTGTISVVAWKITAA